MLSSSSDRNNATGSLSYKAGYTPTTPLTIKVKQKVEKNNRIGKKLYFQGERT